MTLYARIAAALILLAFIAGIYWKGRTDGANAVNARWMETTLAQAKTDEKDRLTRQATIDELSAKLAKQSHQSRQVAQSNLSKIDHYAPTDLPPLPGSFRLWHDAAAEGKTLDDTPRADAAPVSIKDTSAAIADNYAACLYDQHRLSALQEIVKTINGGELEEKDNP